MMEKKQKHLSKITLTLCVTILSSCSFLTDSPDNKSVVDLSKPWDTASPASQNIDSEGLANAVSTASANPRFLSLLAIRNGVLVLEEYFNGNNSESLNDVRSVTKSVISMLTGIALQKEFISNIDQTIQKYFQSLPEIPVDPLFGQITIAHLLNMTSGFQWDEFNGNSYANWIQSSDKMAFLFNQPLVNIPGSTFTYNSASTHLLGVILQESAGMHLSEFADLYLFSKIGINSEQWEDLGTGYVNGGAGIDLKPRDLARLGQLYLQEGFSGNTQVVPADWIRESTEPKFNWRSAFGALQNFSYGFLWWMEESGHTAIFAWGWGGQFIYVVPELELVVVTTTHWQGVSQDIGHQALEQAALSVIIDYIIPAMN